MNVLLCLIVVTVHVVVLNNLTPIVQSFGTIKCTMPLASALVLIKKFVSFICV